MFFTTAEEVSQEMIEAMDTVNLNSLRTHLIYGEIVPETAHSAVEFILKANLVLKGGFLTLFINSPGGECNSAFAIIDSIRMSKIPVIIIATGEASSMAALILATGNRGLRFMSHNTEIITHQYRGESVGTHSDLLASARAGRLLADKFRRHFNAHTNLGMETFYEKVFSPVDYSWTFKELQDEGIVDHEFITQSDISDKVSAFVKEHGVVVIPPKKIDYSSAPEFLTAAQVRAKSTRAKYDKNVANGVTPAFTEWSEAEIIKREARRAEQAKRAAHARAMRQKAKEEQQKVLNLDAESTLDSGSPPV